MTQISFEELASMTETAAVRRQFDERNARGIAPLAAISLTFSIIEVAAAVFGNRVGVWTGLFAAAAVVACIAAFSGRQRRATILAFIAVDYVLLLAISRNSQSATMFWVAAFPLLLFGIRLLTIEHAAVHVWLIGVSIAFAYFEQKFRLPLISASIPINCVAFAVAALYSQGVRRRLLPVWREQQRDARERLRIRDELRSARDLQLAMLPAAPPLLDWLDIAGWSLPASEVGGDYYDYFDLGDGKIAIVSADVAGHGLASGVVLAALRAGLTLLRDRLTDPASVLRRLDALILETSRRRMLVTAVIVLIDRDARRAVITSAGHPPVIVRRGDGTAEMIELFAPPMGSRLPRRSETREIAFGPGDLLVLHTDGVYEAERADGEIYGLERLAESVASTRADDSATAVCDHIVHDLALFRATMPQHDDVTLVALRMRDNGP